MADEQSNWLRVRNGSHGDVPFDAIVGGYESYGPPLYICQASWNWPLAVALGLGLDGPFPGKVRPNLPGCQIAFSGRAPFVSDYNVLVPAWRVPLFSPSNDSIPGNAIQAGYDRIGVGQPGGQPLYFCRSWVTYNGQFIGAQIGKARPGLDGCHIPYGGKELHVTNYYEVLVNPFGGSTANSRLPIKEVGPFSNGDMPRDARENITALVGGYDQNGEKLYMCIGDEGFDADGVGKGHHPGKIRDGFRGCHVAYGEAEDDPHSYYMFVLDWKSNTSQGNKASTFPAGIDFDFKTPLFACQANTSDRGMQPGKWRRDWQSCHIGWGGNATDPGTELMFGTYNVLTD
jgi:hypothetical protein